MSRLPYDQLPPFPSILIPESHTDDHTELTSYGPPFITYIHI